jgi:VCBS repeat-containing protein
VNPVLPGALIGNVNVTPGTDVVGELVPFSDSDGDSGTFSLPALTWPGSNDNYLFALDGDGRTIKLAGGKFNYATQPFYYILVRATDIDGLYSETTYTIVVRQDVSNDISLTGPLDSEYDGNPKSFSALVLGGGVLAIEYQGRNGTSYAASAIAPTNIGDYRVTATATDLDKIGSKSEDFTIRKGIPAIISPPTSTPIIYGQTLASSTLSGGSASALGTFAFTMTSTAPNAGTDSQEVTFTPFDTVNYNTTTTIVSVTVAKATPTISAAPTAGTLTYNQVLSYSSLTGGSASVEGAFDWKSSSTVPAANSTSSQSVVFTPSDTANYNAVELNVSVTVLNTLPTLASFSVNGTEDQTYPFTLGNFTGAYADTEGASLGSITVESLPAAGLLKLGGANVVSNQVIPSNQISTLTYVPEANANGAVATFGVTASDGSGSSSQATVTILLAPANDQPTVQAPASFALTEDQPGNLTYESSPFGDSDSTILTVTLSVSDGVITGNAGTGITVGGTATARTFDGTLTDLNTYFTTAGSISYQGAQDNTASRVLTTLVSDGSLSANTSSTVSFTPVNDAPVILSRFAVGFNEDGTSRAGWTNVNPNDNYGPNKPSWSIGELSATATGSSSLESAPLVAGTYTVQWEHGLPFDNSAPGTLQVSAQAVADGSSATLYTLGRSAVINLRTDTTWTTDSFTFTIPNGDPAIGRYLKLTFNYTAQSVWHDIDSVSVSVSGSSTLSIPALTEDVTGNLQFSGTPFSDADSPSLTVTLGVDVGTITGNPGTGITVGGTATARTLAGTVAALNTYFATAGKITYLAPPDFSGSKTLGILVSDGQLTATGSATINVQPSNDLPVLATPNAISYQDTSATDTFSPTSGTLSGTDLDAGAALSYGISGGTNVGGASTKTGSYGTLAVTVATGAYTFTPNATAINALSSEGSEAYTVTVSDGTGLVSAELMVSIAGVKEDSTITVTGATSYTYSGGGQGPTTYNKSGSGGAVTFIYQGSGGTTYVPNSALPSNAGTYLATAAVAGDANFNPAASVAYAFTIAKADSTISATGTISYTYSASPQGPSTSDKTGSAGAVTYQYEGAGLTSYGPSSIPPLNAGSYSATATVASDDNYNGKESSPLGFTIGRATPTVSIPPTASAIGLTESLSSSVLSGGTASVQGSFAWTSGNNVPGVSGSYAVTFTPQDGANYNTASTAATVAVYDPDLPVPGPDAFAAKLAAGMTTKVTLASLLTNDRPSANLGDIRNMTFVNAQSTSSGGAAIRVIGGWLIYQPIPSAQNGTSDTFTYTVSNGTKTATGTVTVSLAAPNYVAEVAIDRVSGSQVYFSVMPRMTFEVQGTSQLGAGATWTTIAGPNNGNWTSGADGRLIVTDPAAVGVGSRFYRFKWIP